MSDRVLYVYNTIASYIRLCKPYVLDACIFPQQDRLQKIITLTPPRHHSTRGTKPTTSTTTENIKLNRLCPNNASLQAAYHSGGVRSLPRAQYVFCNTGLPPVREGKRQKHRSNVYYASAHRSGAKQMLRRAADRRQRQFSAPSRP